MNDLSLLKSEVQRTVLEARLKNPFAPSCTNTVTINFVANAQLAVGGSAAMFYLPDELEFAAKNSKSLYINMGTQFPVFSDSLVAATKACFENKNAWVLDPVGVGIGSQRNSLLIEFKKYKPQIIRANASEIITLSKLWELSENQKNGNAKGVDSTVDTLDAQDAAMALANYTGGAVAVSGKVDLITDGKIVCICEGGSNFMPRVTGMGCSLGGVCAVYACEASPFVAALTASCVYKEAGFQAHKKSKGPASFEQHFIDELYNINEKKASKRFFIDNFDSQASF